MRREGTMRSLGWMGVAAVVGLGFAAASTWVHYRILNDPLYSSVCDVSATFSCTEAYTSRFGSIGGVPVALIGVLYFGFVLLLIALCSRSTSARQNLAAYVFASATIGLASVLYLGYASFFVLKTVCLLCVGTYVSIIALFLIAGAAAKDPMSTLASRASNDMRTLFKTPAALTTALAFVGAAVVAVVLFPGDSISASSGPSTTTAAAAAQAARSAAARRPPVVARPVYPSPRRSPTAAPQAARPAPTQLRSVARPPPRRSPTAAARPAGAAARAAARPSRGYPGAPCRQR